MGLLENTSTGNAKFLMVKHHALVLESKEPKDGYLPIEVTNPKTSEVITKYIKRYAGVEGKIRRIEWYDTKDSYATRFMGIKIHLRDRGEDFQLDLPFNSRPYDSFTKLMENIDFSEPVEFAVWHDRKQDTTAFAVKQGGVPVKWKYTRDNMGDCPVPKQDPFGKWDFKEQRVWLHKRLTEIVIPQVEELNRFDEPMPEYAGEQDEERAAIQNEPSDLKKHVMSQNKPKMGSYEDMDSIPF